MKPKIFFAAAACLSLLAMSTAAVAITFKADDQDAATMNGNVLKSNGTKTYGKGVLRAEDVKSCVAMAAKANALSKEINAQKQAVHNANLETANLSKLNTDLKSEQAAMDTRYKALMAEKATLDISKPDAVSAYNAKTAALEQDKQNLSARVKAFNEKMVQFKAPNGSDNNLASYNDKIKALDKQLDEFDDKCASKDYYADDYAAAKAALKP